MATLRRIFKQENSDDQKSSSSLRKLFKDKKKSTPHQKDKSKKGRLPEPILPVERVIQIDMEPVDPLPPKQPEEEDPLCDIRLKLHQREEEAAAAAAAAAAAEEQKPQTVAEEQKPQTVAGEQKPQTVVEEQKPQTTTDVNPFDDKVLISETETPVNEEEEEEEPEEEDPVAVPILLSERLAAESSMPTPLLKTTVGRPKAGREKTRRSRLSPHHGVRKDEVPVRCESEQTFCLSSQMTDSTVVDSHSLPETNKELNNIASLPNANIESAVEIQKLVKEMMVLQRNVENLMNFNTAWVKKEQSHREIIELRQDLGNVIQELRFLRTNLAIHRHSLSSSCTIPSETQLQRPMRLSVSRKCPTVADFTLAEQLRILQEDGSTVAVSGEMLLEQGKSMFLPAEIVVRATSLVGKCLLHCCFCFGRGLWMIWCMYLKLYPIM